MKTSSTLKTVVLNRQENYLASLTFSCFSKHLCFMSSFCAFISSSCRTSSCCSSCKFAEEHGKKEVNKKQLVRLKVNKMQNLFLYRILNNAISVLEKQTQTTVLYTHTYVKCKPIYAICKQFQNILESNKKVLHWCTILLRIDNTAIISSQNKHGQIVKGTYRCTLGISALGQ